MFPLEVVCDSDRFSYKLLVLDLLPNSNHSFMPKKILNVLGEKYELL
jgi:hypothetical protein